MQRSFFPHCFKHVITRFVPLAVDQQDPVGTDRTHCLREIKRGKNWFYKVCYGLGESNDGGHLEIDRRLGAAIFDE
jgi:hypothetical protein